MVEKFNCIYCNTENECKRNTHNMYCNNTCQQNYQRQVRIQDWLTDGYVWKGRTPPWVKSFLVERDGEGCSNCKITSWQGQSIVLECDHIDGNHENCSQHNLKLLCPNCHSQTPTYKSKNKGKGRNYR